VSSNFPSACVRRQRGATLVIALVVVLLVVMLTTRLGSDYLVLFRTVENQTALQQARAYLRGAEVVAKEALLRDLLVDTEVDSALELWAQPLLLPLPEGVMSACIIDLQSRLNLNDLGAAADQYSPAQKRFIRLLQTLDVEQPLDSVAAVELAHAVFDWIDVDSTPRYPGGAEELEYLRRMPPYRPANQAFASVTELNLVAGMTPELVAALTPHLAVWGNGSINLNTLDAALNSSRDPATNIGSDAPEPMLLRTLNNPDSLLPLTAQAAGLLAQARSAQGGVLRTLDFFDTGPLAAQQWELDGIGLASEYFLLTADMQVQARHYQLQSVLHRAPDNAGVPQLTVMSRHYGSNVFTMDDYCAAALPR
jgi:general secretion pathway protein K